MDGVQARTPKIARFNNGNVPYELQIQNNTIISNLGAYNQTKSDVNIEPEIVTFSELMTTSTRVGKFHMIFIYVCVCMWFVYTYV